MDYTDKCVISNLSVYGTVSSTGFAVGGIAGELCCGATIQNCSFNGDVAGKLDVGGVVGMTYNGGYVKNCYHNGSVSASDSWAGGVIGSLGVGNYEFSVNAGVYNSYHTGGMVTSGKEGNSGGVVGRLEQGEKNTNCTLTLENNYYLSTTCDGGCNGKNGTGYKNLSRAILIEAYEFLGSLFVSDNDNVNDGFPVFEWQATPYQFKGDGTKESPYQIGSKKELEIMRDYVNSLYYNSVYGHANYIQTADIDLENEVWIPIGLGRNGDDGKGEYNYKTRMFYAEYDGNKHTIKNLNVDGNWYDAGLFGYIRGKTAAIYDLIVDGNVSTTDGYTSGGIVGEMQYGSRLENCAFIGDVTANDETLCVGGVVGHVWASGNVFSCYHNGNVIGGEYAGGITGRVGFGGSNTNGELSNIKNCYQANGKIIGNQYSGSVVANCTYAEGIQNSVIIENCFASSDCDANESSQNATSEDTMLLSTKLLKMIAEDLGKPFIQAYSDEINNGYPVFEWQIKVSGDCNADGIFSIADAVLLQKWILAVPDTKLNDWNAADINEDGKVNVFDLILMKRMLINS